MTTKNESRKVFRRKCYECRAEMVGQKENYEYKDCGLDNVVLMNVLVYHCASCGAVVPEIPAISQLHRMILLDVITKKSLLSGDEVRFLRKMAGISAAEMAEVLGVHKVTLSNWETGAKRISKVADRVLRLASFSRVLQELVNDTTLYPAIMSMAKRLSHFDIHAMLKMIRDVVEGPKSVRIDPAVISDLSRPTPAARVQ